MLQLDQFTSELHEWSLNGTEPACASRDLRYFLDLQEKRLKRAGTTREEEFTHVEDEISGCLTRSENGYSSKILYREAVQHITYRKDGKQIKTIRRPARLYVSFVDKEGQENKEYTCPNCGHPLTALQARDGCPYCGTFFETDEVYPCVSSYYACPDIAERAGLEEKLKKEMIKVGWICGTVVAILCFISWSELDLIFRILGSLLAGGFYGVVFAFLWYMARSLILAMKLFREAGRAIPMLRTVNTRKKMLEFMKAYDPEFSYEAFEGRVISLLQIIAFAEDRDTLSVWEGDRDLSSLDDIVDMQYRGGVYIKRFEEKDHLLRVEGTAYLTNTYIRGTVREKDEKIHFVLEKEANGHADPGFSIHRVSCPSCGGSFDAMHRSDCPYCGTPYDLKKKDWIIKDMRKA